MSMSRVKTEGKGMQLKQSLMYVLVQLLCMSSPKSVNLKSKTRIAWLTEIFTLITKRIDWPSNHAMNRLNNRDGTPFWIIPSALGS